MPFSIGLSVSTLLAILFKQYYQGLHCLPFSAVWPWSTVFAIFSLISVYTICYSQQSDQGLQYLPFSLCSIIKVYTVCHSQHCDQGLHYLLFSAVYTVIVRNNLIRVYTICHSQQSGQGLHYLPFSSVWSRSSSTLSISGTVWSGSTLFVILCSLISVYCFPFSITWSVLYYLPFSVWSRSTLFAILSSLMSVYTICHSQSDQGLPCLPFSASWSGSTLYATLSLIRVYTICYSL